MGWAVEVLELISATAAGINSSVWNVLSHTPVEQLLVDQTILAKLTEMAGTEISPIINNLGETIGYTATATGAANGTTAVGNVVVDIVKTGTEVTQEMIDAAIPLVEGGTTADLTVGETITSLSLDASAGVGGAAGTGVGTTALSTVAGPAIAVALGVASGVALYNIAPDFWINVETKLEEAGKLVAGKVISFFTPSGDEYYDSDTVAIIRDSLISNDYLGVKWESTFPYTTVGLYNNYSITSLATAQEMKSSLIDAMLIVASGGVTYSPGNRYTNLVFDHVSAFAISSAYADT